MSYRNQNNERHSLEANVLQIIRDILSSSQNPRLSVGKIAKRFGDRYRDEYMVWITPKRMGGIIRKNLGLKTQKSHGEYLIPPSEMPKLRLLLDQYGINPAKSADDVDYV